jgi:K(+)-stimulated pyrophosphate-energized sodium pump
MQGTGKPEYDKCVAISTKASLRKMMLPGAIAIISPLIIGFMPGLGAEALGGFLAGATVSGVLMGMFQNNAGGAWDNAKKSFEKGVEINGQMYYKKSEPHKASVTGDTVGDPFKDTSGPSMNILIKLMSIVSLVIAPTLAEMKLENAGIPQQKTEKKLIKETKEVAGNPSDDNKLYAENAYNLINQLSQDNLLNKNHFSASIKEKKLIIDGKLLSANVQHQYKDLLSALSGADFSMTVDIN